VLAAAGLRSLGLTALVMGIMLMPARGRAQDAIGACNADGGSYAEVQIDTRPRVNLELARTGEEHARGLMFRDYLAPDSGMLFVYTFEANDSYWMYNTMIPLSIAFIDREGTIVDIKDMDRLEDPTNQAEAARHVYPSVAPYWYALEANLGWFLDHGVGVGQQIAFCLG
jgi:uncharacterized membrane protein (UPF0127 family)